MKSALRYLLYVLLALVVTAAIAVALIVKLVLAPSKGEWAERVQYGPVGFEVGVPTVLRLATASWFAPQLAGHTFGTRFGQLRFGWTESGGLEASCESCSAAVPGLGDKPVQLQRLSFTVRRDVDALFGNLRAVPVGSTSSELRGRWNGRLTQKDLQLTAEVDDAPIGQWYQILVPELPELRRARIGGTASLRMQAALPEGAFSLQPRLVMFVVDGLGAEGLLDSRAATCGTQARLANDAWLSRGVVAALDADFFHHPGYESASLARGRAPAASGGAAGAVPVAASGAKAERAGNIRINVPTPAPPTLNLQVARHLLPPMPHPEAQLLRDLLYAVEFERVPGKQRLLQAWMDMAPWGEQTCGAEAAARRYFKRSARSLEPSQAIWMATLLRDPDTLVQKWRDEGQIDKPRARSVAEQVREITAGQRAALLRGVANARFTAPATP